VTGRGKGDGRRQENGSVRRQLMFGCAAAAPHLTVNYLAGPHMLLTSR